MTETVTATRRLEVVVYDAPGLGARSYLLHDGDKAFVVDPQRDPHPYLATAEGLGVDITLVLETHVHNDYVSGGMALARRACATYGVPGKVRFGFSSEASALEEGDQLSVGDLGIRVLSTPGHTPHHLAFLAAGTDGSSAILTGGSLLSGGTGRTDLFGPGRAMSLAEAQWRSVRRLLSEVDPGAVVLPTHGFGSFCSAGTGRGKDRDDLTIGSEGRHNPAALLDLIPFVKDLLADPLPVPAYYEHMAPINRAGASEPAYGPLSMIELGASTGCATSGTALVDVRPRRQFAESHLRGALNIELGADMPTYFGWLVPFSALFVVLSETADEVDEARRLLSRIGREVPLGWSQAERVETTTTGRPALPGRRATMKWPPLALWGGVTGEAHRRSCWTCVSLTNGTRGISATPRTSLSRRSRRSLPVSRRTSKFGSTALRVIGLPSPLLCCRHAASRLSWSTTASKPPMAPA